MQTLVARIFQEIYGFIPDMRVDQMLSDDFGDHRAKRTNLHAYTKPNPYDRKRIQDVAHHRSEIPADQFPFRGTVEGFTW